MTLDEAIQVVLDFVAKTPEHLRDKAIDLLLLDHEQDTQ